MAEERAEGSRRLPVPPGVVERVAKRAYSAWRHNMSGEDEVDAYSDWAAQTDEIKDLWMQVARNCIAMTLFKLEEAGWVIHAPPG